MDEALRQYQVDIARAQISRRRFMTGAAIATGSAILAACTPAVASPAPSTAASPAAASAEPSSAAPSPSSTPQPSYAIEDEFDLFNWSTYFSPDNKKAFEQEYGVTINEDNYASNEELIAKLQGGAKGYDIVAPTGYAVATMIAGNLLMPLDLNRIPNLNNADPQFLNAGFDPGNAHSVPKDWGTTGVGYLTDFVKDDITSWQQFYDMASQYSGGTRCWTRRRR